jgi:hypothetical protein
MVLVSSSITVAFAFSVNLRFSWSLSELPIAAIKEKTTVVGFVDDEGYTYDDSSAVVDGRWVGLPIDEDNEYDLTDARLKAWVDQLKKLFV